MSDTGATPPPAPPAKKSSGMNQRIGPFELRIWLVLIAAGLVIGMVIRRRTAATPAAHSSLTVTAPARQTIRSQSASCCAMSSMKGRSSASTPARS